MKRTAVLCAVLCLLTGCAPHAREPEGLVLVQVLGVDGGERVTLTAVCAGQSGEKESLGRVTADSFALALEKLPRSGVREMSLTNVAHIIIGRDVDGEEILGCVLRHRELNPSALVWVTEHAAEILETCGGSAERLAVLAEEGGVTVYGALAALVTEGRAELPRLAAGEGSLQICGSAVKEETG